MESQIEWYDELGSTNDTATRSLQAGKTTPFWVAARRQTAGRGQYGRKWWSDEGALFASGAFRLVDYAIPRESSSRIALLAGVATLETVSTCLISHENKAACEAAASKSRHLSTFPMLGLHWPNDLFYQDKKLAGILVESPQPNLLVVGIGINVNNTMRNAPDGVRERSITLHDCGFLPLDLPSMLCQLAQTVECWLHRFAREPATLIHAFNRYCLQRNRTVRLYSTPPTGGFQPSFRPAMPPMEGICHGIDTEGRLLVEIQGSVQSFVSATVRLVETAAPEVSLDP
ncbi:MAG: biotin--[acetyl-CoA-carboxylase] ligase [Thermoguttaceae bacterium]|nr:biotin--[acetyl-CoA-carboxylase] ligase [Thermoguttaceae bacterium]